MFRFWSLSRNYAVLGQLSLLLALVLALPAFGQSSPNIIVKKDRISREPASYIPDDDVIVKPVDNEVSLYQQYVASDNGQDVVKSRNQLKVWNDNKIFAEQYGIDTTLTGSAYYVPTQEEKWQYFKNRYMRYLRQKGEQPLKSMPQQWYNSYRASNEVDTIGEMESRFKKSNSGARATQNNFLPPSLQQKEVNLWKQTKFIFQPRVDQGLVIVGIKGPIAYARAWVGVNGQAEFNVQKSIDSIGFRVMFNYYTNNGRYFTSIDQRIVQNVYARATSTRDPRQTSVNGNGAYRDDSLMLLYAKQF
jgi:hypothetical protein